MSQFDIKIFFMQIIDNHNNSRTKLLAKNTILLYLRQVLMMAIGLYTSRVVLNILGIEDYGVYNVVGGVVAMFSLFTSSLSTAISRFLSVEMAKGAKHRLSLVFSTSVSVQFIMSILVMILLEVVGVWFLNSHLNIPAGRIEAANWILQTSILIFGINLLIVPCNAAIIAHERMDVFAYASLLEAILKLVVVYSLYISPIDKLTTYGFALLAVSFIMLFTYYTFCLKFFEECRYKLLLDKKLVNEMAVFAGWNFFGSAAYLFNTEGINIATNMFFGVTANAARGVANQVEGVMKQFVGNFTTALNPQIMKAYASGEMDYLYNLVCRCARFSFYLMLIIAVPFTFSAEWIMSLWLGNYPPEAPLFLRLSLIGTMLDLLGNTAAFAVWATGNLKKYYMFCSTIGALVFPISLFMYFCGSPVYVSYIVFAIVYFILIFIRLRILHELINIPYSLYIKGVLLKIAYTSIVATIIPYVFYTLLEDCASKFLLLIFISLLSTVTSIYILGVSAEEKKYIITIIKKIKG